MKLVMNVMAVIDKIQRRLDFKHWDGYPQFSNEEGLGRTAVIAFTLGSIFSLHVAALCLLYLDKSGFINIGVVEGISSSRTILIFQWLIYVIALCIFHLAEFFVTAIWNPSVLTATCFVVNHSKPYTMAMLVSCFEFSIRFLIFPTRNSKFISAIGLALIIIGQLVRSLAMITCAESFNHLIQHTKKQSHKLVTHGIYRYFRHPSYFGFFYWSVGTQLMLGNILTGISFAAASWLFFNRRIPYEEQTLTRLFPKEYPPYMKQSYIGIPAIQSIARLYEKDEMDHSS